MANIAGCFVKYDIAAKLSPEFSLLFAVGFKEQLWVSLMRANAIVVDSVAHS